MRSIEEMLEFSQESFMETYASANKMRHLSNGCRTVPVIMESKSNTKSSKYRTINFGTLYEDDDLKNNNRAITARKEDKPERTSGFKKGSTERSEASNLKMSQDSSVGRRLRKISVEKLTSLGGAMQAAMARRRKSVATEQLVQTTPNRKTERKQSLVSFSTSPNVVIKTRSIGSGSTDDDDFCRDSARVSSGSPASICSSVPTSPNGNISHQGYLEYRNKKKRWEKYWCSLHQGRIHCYLTPQHEQPRDVILLRGYDVAADVKNLNRARFIFHLQQQGFPNIYFSSENYRDYLLWVGCLEREIQSANACLSSPKSSTLRSENSFFINESKNKKQLKLRNQRASLPNIYTPIIKRKETLNELREVPNEGCAHDSVTLQKQRLLNELALQKKQLLEEQRLLNRLPSSPRIQARRIMQGAATHQSGENCEQPRYPVQFRNPKLKHVLDHRRNSFQSLKVPSTSTSFSSLRTNKHGENDVKLSEVEIKLEEMEDALELIKKELKKEAKDKQSVLDVQRQKREIEFLIGEQQNNLEKIFKARCENKARVQRRRSYDASVSSSSKRNRDFFRMSAANSQVTEKQDTTTFRILTPSSSKLSSGIRINKSFYNEDAQDEEEDITTDEDSGFQASNERLGGEPEHLYSSSLVASVRIEEAEKSAFVKSLPLSIPTSPHNILQNPKASSVQDDEIDSSVLAKIEDFELFAKQKLQEIKKQT